MNPLSTLLNLGSSEMLECGLAHTPREIAQQPVTWLDTFRMLLGRQAQIQQFLAAAGLRERAELRPTIFLVGAGTSDYIGHSLHHLLRHHWQCEVIPVASTSLLTDFPDYLLADRRYLWVSFSRSGDSSEGVAVLERALAERPNISHLLITCNAAGRMMSAVEGRANALGIALDDATNDRGLAMTSSFTNMVLAGQALAHAWNMDEFDPILRSLIQAAQSFMPRAAVLASELAEDSYSRACFVGSGALAGATMECALKLLELTAGKFQTLAQPTLALRHGPMAALDRDTLFVSLVSSHPQRRRYELDLLSEIGAKSLARTRVTIAVTNDASLRAGAEHVLTFEAPCEIPDLYRPVLDVIFGQLLGLFSSIRFGLKPDAPSPNGAISRVVQHVGIY